MSAPGEVEFFVDGGAALPAFDEDSVDFGQSQVPRWAVVVVGLLVATVVAALAAQPPDKPVAAPAPEPVISLVSPSSTSGLGPPIPIEDATPVLAVTVPLYLLQPGHLYKITDATAFGVALDGSGGDRVGTSARLVLDAAANRVWVVDGPGGEIIEFDARNLHRLRTMHSKDSIRDAAALNGHLYLASLSGLADIAPDANEPRTLPGLSGYIASVAADPKRHRLLALVLGNGAAIQRVTEAGTALGRPTPVPIGGGMLRVTTDATIWLGGFGSSVEGAVLARLDPTSLQPIFGSPVARRLGDSAWIEAAGDHDVWVRSGGDGEELWCVDGRNGRILQYWPRVHGAVTSRDGVAFVLIAGLLVPIVLQGCAG